MILKARIVLIYRLKIFIRLYIESQISYPIKSTFFIKPGFSTVTLIYILLIITKILPIHEMLY